MRLLDRRAREPAVSPRGRRGPRGLSPLLRPAWKRRIVLASRPVADAARDPPRRTNRRAVTGSIGRCRPSRAVGWPAARIHCASPQNPRPADISAARVAKRGTFDTEVLSVLWTGPREPKALAGRPVDPGDNRQRVTGRPHDIAPARIRAAYRDGAAPLSEPRPWRLGGTSL